MKRAKCPDCRARVEPQRNGDWKCGSCYAAGVTLDTNKLVVASRYVTFSNVAAVKTEKGTRIVRRPGYRLNRHHPLASLLTRVREAVA